MQFRIMGKRIQCLRAFYNREKKMGEQKLIVSVNASMETLPEDLGELSVLYPEELEQLKQWLAKRKEQNDKAKNEKLIETAEATIAEITQTIKANLELLDKKTACSLELTVRELVTVLNGKGEVLQKANKTESNKSLFAEFKSEILNLKRQGKTIKQILEILQMHNPERADYLTYDGLRSFIRRNCTEI